MGTGILLRRCWTHYLGLTQLANEVDAGWQVTASTLSIREDYEGTWVEDFILPLRKLLDDMLVEASPRQFTSSDVSSDSLSGNPLPLLNVAWDQFESNPIQYRAWEKSAIEALLKSA